MNKYQVPDYLDNSDAFKRFYHEDIPFIETKALWEELYFLRPLLWGNEKPWYGERVQRIEQEIRRRRCRNTSSTKKSYREPTNTPRAKGVRLDFQS